MTAARRRPASTGEDELRRIAPLRPDVPVTRPRGGAWLFAGMCSALAIGLFVALDIQRQARSAPDLAGRGGAASGFAEPPPLRVPASAAPTPVAALQVELPPPPVEPRPSNPMPPPAVTNALPPPPPLPTGRSSAQAPVAARRDDQAMVYDRSGDAAGPATAAAGTTGGSPAAASAAAGDDPPLRASVIRGRSSTIVQGSLIAATLETPIDSTRAGFVRAIVARDARGFDDTRILVPRGSRLIGEYASDVQSGQRRVLVTWTRLIRPDGVAIRLGAPSTDRLGQAGIPGRANTHFLARFASAVLQTALAVGTNLASRPGRGSVIVGVPGQATGSIGQSLSPGADLRPTIKVDQGAAVMVFVARDLDFAGAAPRQ